MPGFYVMILLVNFLDCVLCSLKDDDEDECAVTLKSTENDDLKAGIDSDSDDSYRYCLKYQFDYRCLNYWSSSGN